MKKTMLMMTAAVLAAAISGCQPNDTGAAGTTAAVETTAEETTAAKEIDLDEIHTAVKEAYGDAYIPSMPFDGQMLDQMMGVTEDMYESFIAEGPMISAHVDTFVAVKAKEGKGDEVKAALDSYRENLISNTMQYPMNLPKIQASEVYQNGDYVFFVMLGTPTMESEEQGEEAALKSAQENNKIGMDVIAGFFQ